MNKKFKIGIVIVIFLVIIVVGIILGFKPFTKFLKDTTGISFETNRIRELSKEEIEIYDKAFEIVSEKFKNGTLEMPDDNMVRDIYLDKNGNEISNEDSNISAYIYVLPSEEGKEKLKFIKVVANTFVDIQYDKEVERNIGENEIDYTHKWREIGKKIGDGAKDKFISGEITMEGSTVQSIFADGAGYMSTEPFYERSNSEKQDYECWAELSEDKSKICIEVIARVWPIDIQLYKTEISNVTDGMLGMKERAEKEQYESDYELVNNLKSNICSRLAKLYKDNKIDMNGHDKKNFLYR